MALLRVLGAMLAVWIDSLFDWIDSAYFDRRHS